MKKFSFLSALVFSSLILSANAYANNAMDRALGKNIDVEDKAPPVKKEADNIVINSEVGSGSLNMTVVNRNLRRDDHMASGILYLQKKYFAKALDEFQKAKAIINDPVSQRWVDIATNMIKIEEFARVIGDEEALNFNK